MNGINENNLLAAHPGIHHRNSLQCNEPDRGKPLQSTTSRAEEVNRYEETAPPRNRIFHLILKPFKLAGSSVKRVARCCFGCSSNERGGVTPTAEVVEDRNAGHTTHDQYDARASPATLDAGNQEHINSSRHHEQITRAWETMPSVKQGYNRQHHSLSSSSDKENSDRDASENKDADDPKAHDLSNPLAVKKACADITSIVDGDCREVSRSHSSSHSSHSSDRQSTGSSDETPEAQNSNIERVTGKLSDHERHRTDCFEGGLIEEEVVMTSAQKYEDTDESTARVSGGGDDVTFQDDSYIQFFASDPDESSFAEESGQSRGLHDTMTGEGERSDNTSQKAIFDAQVEAEEGLHSASTSASESYDSEETRESSESRGEDQIMRSKSDGEAEADDVCTGNSDDVSSRPSRDLCAGSVSEQKVNGESDENQGFEGDEEAATTESVASKSSSGSVSRVGATAELPVSQENDQDNHDVDSKVALSTENLPSQSSSNSIPPVENPPEQVQRAESYDAGDEPEADEQEASVLGMVFSKLRSVLVSFRQGNGNSVEENLSSSQSERNPVQEEIGIARYGSLGEEDERYSDSSPSQQLFVDGSSSESSRTSGSEPHDTDSETREEAANHVQETVASFPSSQDAHSDDESLTTPGSSSVAISKDSDHSSHGFSSSVAVSYEDSDHSSQVMTSSSAGSFESSNPPSRATLASCSSTTDGECSSQVMTSSSAGTQIDDECSSQGVTSSSTGIQTDSD